MWLVTGTAGLSEMEWYFVAPMVGSSGRDESAPPQEAEALDQGPRASTTQVAGTILIPSTSTPGRGYHMSIRFVTS